MRQGEGEPASLDDLLRRLRGARRSNDDGLKEVAGKVGVSFQAVARWESGADRPSPARLRRWLKAVDMPERWAVLYDDFALEEDVTTMIGKLKPPPAADQIAALRTTLRNTLRTRRE